MKNIKQTEVREKISKTSDILPTPERLNLLVDDENPNRKLFQRSQTTFVEPVRESINE